MSSTFANLIQNNYGLPIFYYACKRVAVVDVNSIVVNWTKRQMPVVWL